MNITMKKKYLKPTMEVFKLNTNFSLLAGSISEKTEEANGMSSGSFGARDFDFDDDFEE